MIPIDLGHMIKGQGQTTLLSPVCCLLIPFFLSSDRFGFFTEDKPEFCTMEGIYVSETFLVFFFRHYAMSLLEFFSRSTACEGKDCVQAVLKYTCPHTDNLRNHSILCRNHLLSERKIKIKMYHKVL